MEPESHVMGYLKALASMPLSGKQAAFFKWQYEQSRPVEIMSYKANFEIREIVERGLRHVKPKIKGCYETAARLSVHCPEINYVEGMAGSIIPIPHAWNCVDGFHFDLTEELVLRPLHADGRYPAPRALTDYVAVVEVDHDELCEILLANKFYGEVAGTIFLRGCDARD